MPDQFERHAKTKWEWGTRGARKQQRQAAADDDPLKDKVPGKKDPSRCKANNGAPHVVTLVRDTRYRHPQSGDKKCGWDVIWNNHRKDYEPGWFCSHEERCRCCGKRFRWSIPAEECPDYTPVVPPAVYVEVAVYKNRRARWRPRKPVPTGPQGYRRKRS